MSNYINYLFFYLACQGTILYMLIISQTNKQKFMILIIMVLTCIRGNKISKKYLPEEYKDEI